MRWREIDMKKSACAECAISMRLRRRHEIIAAPDGAKRACRAARRAPPCDAPCDRDHDVLLMRPAMVAARASALVAAMTRVHRDDHVAAALGYRRRMRRDRRDVAAKEIDDEPIAKTGLFGAQQERLGLRGLGESSTTRRSPSRCGRRRTAATRPSAPAAIADRRRGCRVGRSRLGGIGQREHAVLDGRRELEDHPRGVGTGPDADAIDRRGRAERRSPEQKRAAQGLDRPDRLHPRSLRSLGVPYVYNSRSGFQSLLHRKERITAVT